MGKAQLSAATILTFSKSVTWTIPYLVMILAAAPAPGQAAPFAYITNSSSNNVTVIDTASDTVVGDPIPVGGGPAGVAVNPDGSQVYVSNQDNNTVTVIDTASGKVLGDPIPVGTWPCGIAFNTSGSLAFVANCGSGKASVIDTATRTVVHTTELFASDPIGAAANPKQPYVYVTDNSNGTITRISTTSPYSLNTSSRVFGWPNGIAVSPDGSTLYVTETSKNRLNIVNANTFSITDSVPVGGNPVCVALNPDGSRAYVSNFGPVSNGHTVSVIDTAKREVVTTINVGNAPEGVSVTPDGAKVYVANKFSNNVAVIDAATNTVEKYVTVGSLPTAYGQFIQQVMPVMQALTVARSGKGSGAVTSSPAGIDCGATCKASFVKGNPVTLTALPDDVYSLFSKWSGCASATDNVCRVVLDKDRKVTATFKPAPTFQLTLTQSHVNGGRGTVTNGDLTINCGTDCHEKYLKNMQTTLTATADAGSVFKGWKPSDSCPGTGPCTVTMDKSKSVQGIFVGDYVLKVVSKSKKVKGVVGSGAVTYGTVIDCAVGAATNCSTKVPYHTPVTLTAVPDASSRLKGWTGCPSPSGNACSLTMDKAFTVTATFIPL